jgi:S-adenosylmethionine:tRNA ribosyltransferase-isomerase
LAPAPEAGPLALDFELPDALVAREPPEARGLARDGVRLLVSYVGRDDTEDRVLHARLSELPEILRAGDLLVVNASATLNAALDARPEEARGANAGGANGDGRVVVHLSQQLADGRWVVELREPTLRGTAPLLTARAGERLRLAGGGVATLIRPYRLGDAAAAARRARAPEGGTTRTASPVAGTDPHTARLWLAALDVPGEPGPYLERFGTPIRYAYVPDRWPLAAYQTMFAAEPGSAEMPSAGRPFTPALVERLRAAGVAIARVVLHTGVASLEAHEPPYEEYYRVPDETAGAVNRARAEGRRVIAVGTTVVRALETAADLRGRVRGASGWTDLVVTPERGMRVVDGLLTGFHEPRASHLMLLEAVAGRRHLRSAYAAALAGGYLWHEFGDLHLILPTRRRTRGA